MKKVVLASFLACAAFATNLPSAFAQGTAPAAPAAPTAPAAGAPADPTAPTAAPAAAAPAAAAACNAPDAMAQPEFQVYNNAQTQTTPQAKAAAFETYLTQFPQSAVKQTVLETVMALYTTFDSVKALDAADRLLQVDPSNLKALYVEAYIRSQQLATVVDPTAKQAAADTVAGYAQKGLAATKPACMSDADFTTLKNSAYPTFYSAVGYSAVLKKDAPSAIDAYKKELAMVPDAATKTPGTVLQDIYYLGAAYMQATPPDYLNCSFYTSRAVAYAPDQYKAQFSPVAKYCYKKYHGKDDGYDAVLAAATANLNPPDGFSATITPAPTVAEQIHTIITTTPDLATLAIEDKEQIFQSGSPEDAAKVWDTIKGKSVEIPGALVIESSPTALKVAVAPEAIQNKTADFTFNLKAEDEPTGTAAQKAAAAKMAAARTAATAVGQTVTLSGTYDSFTPKPLMITMSDGEVVLAKAKAAAPTHTAAHAPAHHAAAHK